MDSLIEENKLEIELYEYAVRLNKLMTERWKKEVYDGVTQKTNADV
jgi:hypothetical protein